MKTSLFKKILDFQLMKRFLTIKGRKVSIRRRIIRVVIGSCVITLLICLFFSLLVILVERSLFVKNGKLIGERTTEVSSDAILKQSIVQSCEYIVSQTELLDLYLLDIQNNLVMVGDFVTEIYRSPQSFVPISVPHFTQVPAGVYSDQWHLDYGVSMNSALQRELGLLGNAKHLIKSMVTQRNDIRNVYIVTASGLNLHFDNQAETKQKIIDAKIKPSEQIWYRMAKEQGKPVITDIYEDEAGRGLCFTFCLPFYDRGGKLAGVIGADISMEEMSNIIGKIVGKDIEFAMLISNEGILANSLKKEMEFDDNIHSYLDEIRQVKNDSLLKEVMDYSAGIPTTHEAYIIWDTLSLTGWKLIGYAPITTIIAPAERISLYISQYTEQFIRKAIFWVDIIQIVNILVFIALVAIFIFYARRTADRIVSPIVTLSVDTLKIGHGELEFLPEIDTGDEIELLTNTINHMVGDIIQITREKQRIGAELEVARHVQASMLPNIFPPFPNRPEFDIYGFMLPAKEVGGDFYDFFFIDRHRLALVIADVSGKGVPASLFMVITKTLIKNIAQYASSPSETFETVNNMLCENNDMGMFVTAFMGVFDLRSETLTYVNAGHNPPYKKHRNGTLEPLLSKTTLVLAAMNNTPYIENEVSLEKGDMLYLYTDGVVEAVNKHEHMFTEKRLVQTITKYNSDNLKDVADNLVHEIDVFTDGVEQADDITVLVLRVN